MLREIHLSGSIESIHLHDGMLEVTIDGEAMSFPVGAQAPKPERQPRQRRTNGQPETPSEAV